MNWDAETLRLAWEVLVTVAALAGSGIALWATVNFASRREMRQIAERIEEVVGRHAERLTAVESELAHAPKHADLIRLEMSVRETGHRVAKLEGTLDGVRALLESIHDHLLNAQQ
jgi:predicted component of type VI protein secretion system